MMFGIIDEVSWTTNLKLVEFGIAIKLAPLTFDVAVNTDSFIPVFIFIRLNTETFLEIIL